MNRRCIAILGGSFDPVHSGHVALARYFITLLKPDELRILPAGNPWQKLGLQASGAQRLAMLELAFNDIDIPVVFDQRELRDTQPSVTIASLQSMRAELGNEVSLNFLMGADQLQHLDTWQQWQALFAYANLCAAARPGFVLAGPTVPIAVSTEFAGRAATPEQLRSSAYGQSFLAPNLAVDISATTIRAALKQSQLPLIEHRGQGHDQQYRQQHSQQQSHQGQERCPDLAALLPPAVLDYIQQHHLYKN